MIYDISYLLPSYQKEFIENVLKDVWDIRIREKPERYLLIILEECHLYMRNVRSMISQNLMRLMSVGANTIKTRISGIGVDIALIDTAFLRLANQKWIFRLIREENQRRKISRTFGWDFYRCCLGFGIGQCFYCLRNFNPKIYQLRKFQSERLPTEYRELEPQRREPRTFKEKTMSVITGKEYFDSPYGQTFDDEDDAFVEEEFDL